MIFRSLFFLIVLSVAPRQEASGCVTPLSASPPSSAVVYVIMAPSSLGKSTIGKLLAERLGVPFYEPDDYHSPENRRKISEGIPLTDEERWPWLDRMKVEVIDRHLQEGTSAVMANSALKRVYRDRMGLGRPGIVLIYLDGTEEQALAQNRSRLNHFAKEQVVRQNFAILERPAPEEGAWWIRVEETPQGTFAQLLDKLRRQDLAADSGIP